MDLFSNQPSNTPSDKENKGKLQLPLTKEEKARMMLKRKLLKALMEKDLPNQAEPNGKPL